MAMEPKKTNPRMNSRQRVLAALKHAEPDRVPLDLGAMASTGIMAIAYARLKEHLGISAGRIRVFDLEQQLAEVEPEILARFGIDVISLNHSLGEPQPGAWKPWQLPDGTPCEIPAALDLQPDPEIGGWLLHEFGFPMHRMSPSSLYFTRIFHPLAGASSSAELEAFPRPLLSDEELGYLEQRACFLYQHTDFAIMASYGGSIHEMGQNLRGWQQFMVDLALGGAFIEDLIAGIVEAQLQNLKLFLEAVGNYVQIIQFGDDLGMQDRPQISPQMYREYLLPGHQQLFQHVHQHSGCAVFLHSCGSIYPLIPDLIEAGVDILNPLQTSAANMQPQKLKAEFGDRLVMWGGGCDTQHLLPQATPDEIAAHVGERLEIFAPGGGFVFNQIHNIQADVPPENIVAMLDTARAYRYGSRCEGRCGAAG